MGLIDYTPAWLVRWIADGALGVVYFIPSIIGLFCYAWLCFWLADRAISLFGAVIFKQMLRRAVASDAPVGAVRTRGRLWLGRTPGLLLQAWIGLPALHVLNLIMSEDPGDTEALKQLSTGYSWQSAAFAKLPIAPLSDLRTQLSTQYLVDLAIIVTALIYIYLYWYKGFDVTRRIRRVGDILLSKIQLADGKNASLEQALMTLRSTGWTPEECKSAAWFLTVVNLRLLMKTEIYETLTPAKFGVYKTSTRLAIAAGLTVLHPVVSGLYIVWAMKSPRQPFRMQRLYKVHFAQLPEDIRTLVSAKYPDH